MASTRSHSTRNTRSNKVAHPTVGDVSSMEVDEVVSGLQQLSRGATDFSKNTSNCVDQQALKTDNGLGVGAVRRISAGDRDSGGGGGNNTNGPDGGGGKGECLSFPNNLLDAAASSGRMETDPVAAVDRSVDPAASSSASSSSDSSDSSDSEDTETDLETAAKNKAQDQDNMGVLEKMFAYARELLYDEKMRSVNTKLEEIRSGKANEYLTPLGELQANMGVKTEITSKRREFRLLNAKHKYEAEELASHQNFDNEKELLYDRIKADIEEKIRRLEEDRHNDFSSDAWFETSLKKKKKTSVDLYDKRKKPCVVSGPYIVYMLNEVDIMEDWTAIKKVLATPKRKYVDPIY